MSVAENDQKSNISLHTETEGSDDDDRDSTSICKKNMEELCLVFLMGFRFFLQIL